MKVIIAGSRGFDDYKKLCEVCWGLTRPEDEIVSGGANGADKLGERFAKEHYFKLTVFPADWNQYGRRAGYIRNTQMAQYADILIAFWDGESKGTKHMIDLAIKHRLETHIFLV